MKNSLPDGQLSRKMPQRIVRDVLEALHSEGKMKKCFEYIIPSKLKWAKKLARLELLPLLGS